MGVFICVYKHEEEEHNNERVCCVYLPDHVNKVFYERRRKRGIPYILKCST